MDDLLNQIGYGTTADSTLIPTAKVLQIAEQADIIPTVLNASGAVLEQGRTRRIATRAQTLALYARDGGCSFPGCAHPTQFCERHHVIPWIDGGKTDLNNLALLCIYPTTTSSPVAESAGSTPMVYPNGRHRNGWTGTKHR